MFQRRVRLCASMACASVLLSTAVAAAACQRRLLLLLSHAGNNCGLFCVIGFSFRSGFTLGVIVLFMRAAGETHPPAHRQTDRQAGGRCCPVHMLQLMIRIYSILSVTGSKLLAAPPRPSVCVCVHVSVCVCVQARVCIVMCAPVNEVDCVLSFCWPPALADVRFCVFVVTAIDNYYYFYYFIFFNKEGQCKLMDIFSLK